jgi:allantoicase
MGTRVEEIAIINCAIADADHFMCNNLGNYVRILKLQNCDFDDGKNCTIPTTEKTVKFILCLKCNQVHIVKSFLRFKHDSRKKHSRKKIGEHL